MENRLVFKTNTTLYPIDSKVTEVLKKYNAEYDGKDCITEDDFIKYAKDADILEDAGVSQITRRVFENLPKLKAVVSYGVGYDNVDIEAARDYGVSVSNTPGINEEDVAVHAVALILCYLRNIIYLNSWVKEKKWVKKHVSFPGVYPIKGEIVGIVGFGNIGKRIYEKLTPFGPNFYVYDPYKKLKESYNFKKVTLKKLLQKSKYIILACSLTKENIHMIDEEQFKLMRSDAAIINVARGKLINEKVLVKYLSEGKIAEAALDVFEDGVLPKDSPLLKLDNVILTPHSAGYSPGVIKLMKKIALDEIIRLLSGEKPLHRAN